MIGPVFNREVVIVPRRPRIYVARSAYVLALLLLLSTAWLVLTGTQLVRDVGDMALFGADVFQILAPLQLALAVFFSALLAASGVAHEKDRGTFVLLLLTNLGNAELVLGRLLASLLYVLVLGAAALPVFMLTAILGGVSFGQIGRAMAVMLASVLLCGSLGSTLALWREKTFQALAITILAVVFWLGAWELVASGALGQTWWAVDCRTWAAAFSPWRAVLSAMRPALDLQGEPAWGPLASPWIAFLVVSLALSAMLNGLAVAMVRRWACAQEPDRALRPEDAPPVGVPAEVAAEAAPRVASPPRPALAGTRAVWDNPVIWREIRTWAYGRKVLVVRLGYLLLFALGAANLVALLQAGPSPTRAEVSLSLAPLLLLSLVLVNAQAVTSLTSERDTRALDLLLVTDLTPKEIVFGKLGGVFYNTKEIVLLPMLLVAYLWTAGAASLENALYLAGGLAVLYLFAAVLGLHVGMTYASSRTAIGVSLGTIFFLFVGVATCMRLMIAFSGSFQAQLQPFLAFMVGGGIGLYVALGVRNPSAAIAVASFVCPLATFHAITSFLLEYTLAVFLVTAAAYGFTTAAMLVPAIYEFDVATGRTTIGEE